MACPHCGEHNSKPFTGRCGDCSAAAQPAGSSGSTGWSVDACSSCFSHAQRLRFPPHQRPRTKASTQFDPSRTPRAGTAWEHHILSRRARTSARATTSSSCLAPAAWAQSIRRGTGCSRSPWPSRWCGLNSDPRRGSGAGTRAPFQAGVAARPASHPQRHVVRHPRYRRDGRHHLHHDAVRPGIGSGDDPEARGAGCPSIAL